MRLLEGELLSGSERMTDRFAKAKAARPYLLVSKRMSSSTPKTEIERGDIVPDAVWRTSTVPPLSRNEYIAPITEVTPLAQMEEVRWSGGFL